MAWVAYFAIGLGLSVVAGFRVFIPLFALALAAHFEFIGLNEEFRFLADSSALWIIGAAMFIEILAYYVPWVDNALDVFCIPIAGIMGTIFLAAILPSDLASPATNWAIALITGGGIASTVGVSTAGMRATSTGTTGGLGNFVFSTFEIVCAALGAFFIYMFANHPYILLLFVLIVLLICVFVIYLTFKVIKRIFKIFFSRKCENAD